MGCSIIIPFTTDINKLYNLGINEAISLGGQLSGDKKNGTFAIPALGGKFEGSYEVNNNALEINLSKKPLLISCSIIEAFLKIHIK